MLSRTDLVTWVLGAVAKPIETRVPKLLEKEQCDPASSAWHFKWCFHALSFFFPLLSFSHVLASYPHETIHIVFSF